MQDAGGVGGGGGVGGRQDSFGKSGRGPTRYQQAVLVWHSAGQKHRKQDPVANAGLQRGVRTWGEGDRRFPLAQGGFLTGV